MCCCRSTGSSPALGYDGIVAAINETVWTAPANDNPWVQYNLAQAYTDVAAASVCALVLASHMACARARHSSRYLARPCAAAGHVLQQAVCVISSPFSSLFRWNVVLTDQNMAI